MTFVKMGSNLQPLCPQHHSQMVHGHGWLKLESNVSPMPCYACDKPECEYLYDVTQGYFTINEGEHIERDKRYWQNCGHEGLPMHIVNFDPQGNVRMWKCGQIGCIGGRVTEGDNELGSGSYPPPPQQPPRPLR